MDYMFGRLALGILKAFSWIALALGIFIAFGGMTSGLIMFARQDLGVPIAGSFFSFFSGFLIAFFAMITLAFLDHMSATIDSAVWAKRSFKIAEQQLAVSKDALRVGKLVQVVQAPEQLLNAAASSKNQKGRGRRWLGMLGGRERDQTPYEEPQRQEPVVTGGVALAVAVPPVQKIESSGEPTSVAHKSAPAQMPDSMAPDVLTLKPAPKVLMPSPDGSG